MHPARDVMIVDQTAVVANDPSTAPMEVEHHQDGLALPRLTAQPLTAFTSHTLTSLPDLLREFQGIRDQGYAVEREEWTPGLAAVAAPVRTPRLSQPNVVAAWVVSFPAAQLRAD